MLQHLLQQGWPPFRRREPSFQFNHQTFLPQIANGFEIVDYFNQKIKLIVLQHNAPTLDLSMVAYFFADIRVLINLDKHLEIEFLFQTFSGQNFNNSGFFARIVIKATVFVGRLPYFIIWTVCFSK